MLRHGVVPVESVAAEGRGRGGVGRGGPVAPRDARVQAALAHEARRGATDPADAAQADVAVGPRLGRVLVLMLRGLAVRLTVAAAASLIFFVS